MLPLLCLPPSKSPKLSRCFDCSPPQLHSHTHTSQAAQKCQLNGVIKMSLPCLGQLHLSTHTVAILLFQVHGFVTTTKTIVAMRPLYVYSPKRHSALGTPCSLPECRLWPCTFERTGINWVQTQSTNWYVYVISSGVVI